MPIKLNSTGGGSVSITPPVTASTYTLTAPAVTANIVTDTANSISQTMLTSGIAGNGPCFSAYASIAQSISGSTWTKIQFNAEEWDTANCFDSTTNYRFTPNVAGYYQINCMVRPNNNYQQYIGLYKNGNFYRYIYTTTYMFGSPLSTLVYCNGTTDYLEVYFWSATGISTVVGNPIADTWFNGYLARAA